MPTYPLLMPSGLFGQQSFDPVDVSYQSPAAGGRLDAVNAGNALWAAQWTVDGLDEDDADALRAFRDRLRGAQRTFLAYDQKRPYPKAYPKGFAGLTRAGGGAFDGTATAWTQTITSEGEAVIALYGLPVGLALSVGDYIGWKWDAAGAPAGSYQRRALCRATIAATANGTGVIGVYVEPPLPTLVVPVGAIAHLDTPCCVMKQVPDQTQLGPSMANLSMRSGTFTAIQDLRP